MQKLGWYHLKIGQTTPTPTPFDCYIAASHHTSYCSRNNCKAAFTKPGRRVMESDTDYLGNRGPQCDANELISCAARKQGTALSFHFNLV